MCSLGYTVDMGIRTGFRITNRKRMGWAFAFVLCLTQVYPAFGACLCLHATQEPIEVSASTELSPSCHPVAPATREETDSGSRHCTQQAHGGDSGTGISRDECCGADGGWTSPLPASLSRTVEVRPVFDAMPWTCSENAGTQIPRPDRLALGGHSGIHAGVGTTLYLLNASLLI